MDALGSGLSITCSKFCLFVPILLPRAIKAHCLRQWMVTEQVSSGKWTGPKVLSSSSISWARGLKGTLLVCRLPFQSNPSVLS